MSSTEHFYSTCHEKMAETLSKTLYIPIHRRGDGSFVCGKYQWGLGIGTV